MHIKFYPSKNEHLWYYRLTLVTYATVKDSGEDPEYYIVGGEHDGKHVLKADCHELKKERLTA